MYLYLGHGKNIRILADNDKTRSCPPSAPEETITIATLLKGGWQIAGYTSTLDNRSAFILFRHPDEPYLVQCRASYDVTRTPSVTANCYKLH